MANEKHLLLTATGGWVDSDLANEVWQVGVRLVLNFGTTDPIDTLPNNWDPVAATISRTETDWNIDGNWSIDGPLTDTFAPDDYLNDQAAPAFADWMDTAGRSTGCRLDFLKLYPIGTNGKAIPAPPYATGSPMELNWTSGFPVGSSSAQQLPLQIAGVVSHRTGQLGRRGRGRMFAPALTTAAVDHDSLFSSSWQSTAANVQKNTMEALAYDHTIGGEVHVRPIVTGAPWSQYGIINQVRVGNVPDTQRRRRDTLVEDYQSVTFP